MRRIILIIFASTLFLTDTKAKVSRLPVLKAYFQGEIVSDMDYANGSMILTDNDGKVVQLPAKFKIRGATARAYLMKPSLNMKLRTEDYSEEKDSALLGMRSCSSWILDAMAIDRICMRNRVAFDIWNEFSRLPYNTNFDGRNGTEGKFLELYINDKYYGIYCLSDRINRKLLDLKKTKENDDGSVLLRGALYKSGTDEIANQNEPSYSEDSTACVIAWHDAWELTYPDDHGCRAIWQPLRDAILKGYNEKYVKQYFFLENLADYQILIMALAISDNWGNKNRFLSIRNISKDINDPDPSEANKRRFVITPWDLDTSLGGHYNGDYYNGNYTEWPISDIIKNAPYPISPICSDAEYNDILHRRWLEGRTGAFSIPSVCRKLERYRDLFLLSGAWQRMVDNFEAQKYRPKYVLDLTKEISLIEDWYISRFQQMDEFFGINDKDGMIHEELNSHPEESDSAVYDLSGQEVIPKSKGIYIKHRKKILMK